MGWLLLLVKPFLKSAASKIIDSETETLKNQLKAKLASGGTDGVDDILEATEARILALINTKLPNWSWIVAYRSQLTATIQAHTDQIKATIDAQVAAQGPAAIDKVLDTAKDFLEARISAL